MSQLLASGLRPSYLDANIHTVHSAGDVLHVQFGADESVESATARLCDWLGHDLAECTKFRDLLVKVDVAMNTSEQRVQLATHLAGRRVCEAIMAGDACEVHIRRVLQWLYGAISVHWQRTPLLVSLGLWYAALVVATCLATAARRLAWSHFDSAPTGGSSGQAGRMIGVDGLRWVMCAVIIVHHMRMLLLPPHPFLSRRATAVASTSPNSGLLDHSLPRHSTTTWLADIIAPACQGKVCVAVLFTLTGYVTSSPRRIRSGQVTLVVPQVLHGRQVLATRAAKLGRASGGEGCSTPSILVHVIARSTQCSCCTCLFGCSRRPSCCATRYQIR